MIDPAARGDQTQTAQFLTPVRTAELPKGLRTAEVLVERAGPGRSVVLRIGSQRLKATSSFLLRTGEIYRVLVERTGRQVQLKVLSQIPRSVSPAEVVAREGLPTGPLAEAVVRAFVRSGLPLEAGRLLRSIRRVANAAGERLERVRELARFDAIQQRKGLEFTEADLPVVLGFGQRHPSGERDTENHRKRKDGPGRSPDASDVEGAVVLSEGANHPVQLFNHVVGPDDHWVIIPIGIADSEISGSLRIRIPRGQALGTGNAQAFLEAVLMVDDGSHEWAFALNPSPSGIQTTLVSGPDGADEEAVRNRFQQAFAAAAAAPGVSEGFDGFSLGDAGDIMRSVDSSV